MTVSSRRVLRCAALAVVLTVSVFHNASAVTSDEDEDEGELSQPPTPPTPSSATVTTTRTLPDRVSEGGGGARNAENRLTGDDALDRLRHDTGGRAMAAAKRVVDETVHKLTATVDDIRRTISGDDADDGGGDRRVSAALDGLFRAVGAESRAAFDYASDVINETADRAKAAVDRAQRQKPQRLQRR